MNNRLSHIVVYAILLLLMVGGCVIIMHKPCWTMDDDTIIQCGTGMGKLMKMNEPPVFVPEQGRFFPMAYQHNNLVLLFDRRDQIPASSVYTLNAVAWCLFVALLYWLCVLNLQDRVPSCIDRWLALLVVIIMGQRTFHMFTLLWTTFFWDFFLSICVMLALYYYSKYKKLWQLIILELLTLWLTLCIETNIAIPLVLGFVAFLTIGKSERDLRLSWSMAGIVGLFAVLYLSLIVPNITSAYDGAHGIEVTRFQNMLDIVLGQKLLILIVATFFWRLYKVFINKDPFDRFSDTLLCVAIGTMLADFIMRLNWSLYYVIPILLAIPSMIRLLDFDSRNKSIASIIALSLVFLYFVPKYPKLVKDIWRGRENQYIDFARFDNYCKEAKSIVWYQNSVSTMQQDDNFAHSHVCMHLSQVLNHPSYSPVSVENNSSNEYLLIVPVSTSDSASYAACKIEEKHVQWRDEVMSLKIYYVKK